MSIIKLPNICNNLELISVYDINGKSSTELIYKFGIKINELIREYNQDKTIMADSILELKNEVNTLLNQGLRDEVEQVLLQWKQSGVLSEMILGAISDIENTVNSFDERITKSEVDILALKNPIVLQLPVYTTTEISQIEGLKIGMVVFDSTRGKCIVYKDNINGWANLDGSRLLEV